MPQTQCCICFFGPDADLLILCDAQGGCGESIHLLDTGITNQEAENIKEYCCVECSQQGRGITTFFDQHVDSYEQVNTPQDLSDQVVAQAREVLESLMNASDDSAMDPDEQSSGDVSGEKCDNTQLSDVEIDRASGVPSRSDGTTDPEVSAQAIASNGSVSPWSTTLAFRRPR